MNQPQPQGPVPLAPPPAGGPQHKITPHRKVKTGCLQCKKRRIKCDETKPVCLKCVRYPSECSFNSEQAAGSSITPVSPPTSISTVSSPSLGNPTNGEQSLFTLQDLELLQHWTLYTCETMSDVAEITNVMKVFVPGEGVRHAYLMHAIMALSSLHIARLHPSQEANYVRLATHHETLALSYLRTALHDITATNCHAIHATGHLIVKYAFAVPQSQNGLVFTPRVGLTSEFLPLLRGVWSVFDICRAWLIAGPLNPCLGKPLDPNPDFSLYPNDSHFASLIPHLSGTSSPTSPYPNTDPSPSLQALHLIRSLAAHIHTPDRSLSPQQIRYRTKTLVFRWAALVPQSYIQAMSDREPEALVVLGCYCVLLKMMQDGPGYWFMDGAAERLLEGCRRELEGYEGMDEEANGDRRYEQKEKEKWRPVWEWLESVVGVPQREGREEEMADG